MSIGRSIERQPPPPASALQLDRFVPYRLTRIEFRLSIVATAIARRFGLARAALRVITVLAEHENSRISALAERTPLRVSALSRMLTELERQGLTMRSHATRGAAPGDHRAVAVSLTKAGRDLANRILATFREVDALLMAGFAAEERQTLIGLLNRIDDGVALLEAQFAAKTERRRKR